METKDLLLKLCRDLEIRINQSGTLKRHKIVLESGVKPPGYFLPQMHIGTTKTLPNETEFVFYVEIWFDDKCIFRLNHYIEDSMDYSEVENLLMGKMLEEVFASGIMLTYNDY